MTRRVAYWLLILVGGILATALGAMAALVWTNPGRALLTRVVNQESGRLVRGTLTVGRLSGNFLSRVRIEDLEIRDTSGALLLAAPVAEVNFALTSLLAGRIIFDAVTLERPRLEVVQHRGGRLNYEEVLRSGEGAGDGPSSHLELRQLRVTDGFVQISLPWSYPGQLTTDQARDSALAADRAVPGRRIIEGRQGLTNVRTIEGLTAHIPSLRISTPDNLPVRLVINRLQGRVSDPLLDIRALTGTVETAGDSLIFALAHLELPGTTATGRGRVDWPQDTLLFNAEFVAPRLALADIRFISPDFPDFTGRARARISAENGTLLRSEVSDLAMGDATSSLSGELVALSHLRRGLGFSGLSLTLRDIDLDIARPYLDTIPMHGQITGALRADGYFDDLTIALDWVFRDAAVPGNPLSRIALDGRISAGGTEGFTFHDTAMPAADLDLGTVRNVAPAVILDGRLALSGRLDGPWTNALFTGTLEHRDGDRPPTLAEGQFRLDTRGTVVRLAGELDFQPLALAGLTGTWPDLVGRPELRGRFTFEGTSDSLMIDADLTGAPGHFIARGLIRLGGDYPAADDLLVVFDGVNLAALDDRLPLSRLAGVMLLDGRIQDSKVPEGDLILTLSAGTIREVPIDSAVVRMGVREGMLVVDTAEVRWPGGSVGGAGSLGWAAPDSGAMHFAVVRGDLAPLDSLLRSATGVAPDTTLPPRPLAGHAWFDAQLHGSLDRFHGVFSGEVEAVSWEGWWLPAASGTLIWDGGQVSTIRGAVQADSLSRPNFRLSALHASAHGPADSLHWRGGLRAGPTAGITAAGQWVNRAERFLATDTVFLDLGRNTWTLRESARIEVTDSLIRVGDVAVVAADGSGILEVSGDIPGRAPGNLTVRLVGLAVQDLYGVLQQDTTGVGGSLSLDLRIGGTAGSPTLRGSASAQGPIFGDVRAPLARVVLNYENRLLESNLTFWRTGEPILEVESRLPLDLAFTNAAADRFLPGALEIRAFADSLDLAVVEALTPNLRRVTGSLSADARVGGSWAGPLLSGQVEVRQAGMSVPSLGVRYDPVGGVIRLDGDSLWFDQVAIGSSTSLTSSLFQRAASGGGLVLGGSIRFPRLTSPDLRLQLTATDFLIIDARDFLTARTSANVQLRGPLWRPVLTGSGRLTGGVLRFSDLVSKSVVNLWDPAVADLVDTLELRRLRLGAAFQSRFLDSLAIQDLNFTVDQDFWLRSNEANVQLVGNVIVNKVRRQYRVDGMLNTPRGTYTLKIGPVSREFVVQSGTVRYFGTPDLNADVDITATHQLRSTEPGLEEVTITARIQGTLLVPRLALESDIRPAVSERDIIGLLLLGRLNSGLGASDAFSVDAGLAYLSGALSSELSRYLISDAGVPVDMIEIRVPFEDGRGVDGAGAMQLVAGWALGRKWFVTLNAGFCSRNWAFNARNFGASLEYRLSREWRVQVSAEPGRICSVSGVGDGALAIQRYQFGSDLRWEREY